MKRPVWVVVLEAAGVVVAVEGPFANRQAAVAWAGTSKKGSIVGRVFPAVRGEKERQLVADAIAKGVM